MLDLLKTPQTLYLKSLSELNDVIWMLYVCCRILEDICCVICVVLKVIKMLEFLFINSVLSCF